MSLIMKKHVVYNYDSSMDFAGVTVQITFTYESTQCALVFKPLEPSVMFRVQLCNEYGY